jgi:glucosamine--fructose-6-phosphate aminotransferase (isomerizing)
MCGIVGFTGNGPALPVLLEGLSRLEYRGYDSAGIALEHAGALHCVRRPGKLSMLREAVAVDGLPGHCGIGHTRWATHGAPTERNAHPHLDATTRFAVVHNGIIENYQALRDELSEQGVAFRSDTDSEVIVHLVARAYAGDLRQAVLAVLPRLEGSYALAMVAADEPGLIVGARHGSPLVVGQGDDAYYLASDVLAFIPFTDRAAYLEEGQVCVLRPGGCAIIARDGAEHEPRFHPVAYDRAHAEKDGYAHFMLKEIHQQPEVLLRLLAAYVTEDGARVTLPSVEGAALPLQGIQRIVIVACGTAWHAGLVGKYLIEEFARVPVELALASEFRYGTPVLDAATLVIGVSQSGETADTLEALRLARPLGAPVLSIVNVAGSTIDREAQAAIHLLAGPEIGVASTKAYTAQITALALFALHLGTLRGALSANDCAARLDELRAVPAQQSEILRNIDAIEAVAGKPRYYQASHAMFIGRGYNFPSALEGALKLKEISYIHVEGYAAGEMKHGPIALVTDRIPVVSIAVQGPVYAKVLSNIEEIRARKGIILAIATEGDHAIDRHSDDVLRVPASPHWLSPLLVALPLQLLAYTIAVTLGRDVDQPRNLAKSVTVE